jgi:hypothetical protein
MTHRIHIERILTITKTPNLTDFITPKNLIIK